MRLVEFADRRFRLAGREVLGRVRHFMGSFDALSDGADGRLVSFGAYDYLGLSADERVRQASADAALHVGVGVSASRMIGGERNFHADLEANLAAFVGTEASLCLVSGYLTNLSLVQHLLGSRDLLVIDELSHNSIVSGASASRARTITFRHNDLDHLEEILATQRSAHARCLIVVEGLYSMDGDIPDLPRLIAMKHAHDCWLMVDEAHSIGVLGETGRGISEHWGTDPREIDLIVGTLSKAFVSCGGFVAGEARVLEWLHFTLPGFVFSVGMAPPIAAAADTALRILREEPWRIARLRSLSAHFVAEAERLGLDCGPSRGHGVVPLFFRDNEETVICAEALLSQGFYCPPIVQVGVPRDQPRLRFFLSASHTEANVSAALEVVAAACNSERNLDRLAS
ncbi:aminotransferase class I/II-fold pyridoxal phosphate-dependent enzyme [Acetobacteraceae bacterium KSS8]|uniref:Aminotransferase class I/II-fold pyridoxal phosphate-dependent enzyme n=1 Tax=Endosaccharibacter trunci TaxID=2812733 RepID=A0ABT1W7A6_9PROT|nr:aminotransferase class I/II-fold pyridoxal phosphate-dependent enzyme [Acetobacteraceae bacterium KSS8]